MCFRLETGKDGFEETGTWKSETAGETAQRLRARAALPEDLSSTPRKHVVAHDHL